jgi:hypothetical protein
LRWRTRLGRLLLARLGALPETGIWAPSKPNEATVFEQHPR